MGAGGGSGIDDTDPGASAEGDGTDRLVARLDVLRLIEEGGAVEIDRSGVSPAGVEITEVTGDVTVEQDDGARVGDDDVAVRGARGVLEGTRGSARGEHAEDIHLPRTERSIGASGRDDADVIRMGGGIVRLDDRPAGIIIRLIEGDAAVTVGASIPNIHLGGSGQHVAGGGSRGQRQDLEAAAETIHRRGGR